MKAAATRLRLLWLAPVALASGSVVVAVLADLSDAAVWAMAPLVLASYATAVPLFYTRLERTAPGPGDVGLRVIESLGKGLLFAGPVGFVDWVMVIERALSS